MQRIEEKMGRESSNAPANQKQQSSLAYTVEQLVAVNPYNPDILPDLENYVNEQVRTCCGFKLPILNLRVQFFGLGCVGGLFLFLLILMRFILLCLF